MPFLLILPKVAKAGRGGIVGWKWNPCLGDGWWAGPTNPLITPNTQQSATDFFFVVWFLYA